MIYLLLFWSFMKVGFCSFGGMTMIPVISDIVLRYGWMTSEEVLDIVAVAEMTPGSLGINSASFVGFRTAGWLGAFCANLGTMMPSLTLCMLATHFITKFKGNRYLEWLFTGIRPVCIGMLAAVVVSQSRGTFLTGEGPLGIGWNLVAIAAVVGFLMNKLKLSIPKTILLGALLGLLFG